MRSPLALVLALSAAACATQAPESLLENPSIPTIADTHKIDVAQSGERLEIDIVSASVTAEDEASIARFGRLYRDMGHGPLIVSTPAGAGDATNAALVAQAARLELAETGVDYASIAGSTYDASGKATAPVVLSFTRYTAEAPTCEPVWKYDLADNGNAAPPANFGCFLSANLAAMIGDPADLVDPREMTPRDGARRAAVMEKYRAGQPTGADRSSDERVAISEAIR
jgi:pilus assembly protein CpaD